jgi:hypothetical protein
MERRWTKDPNFQLKMNKFWDVIYGMGGDGWI